MVAGAINIRKPYTYNTAGMATNKKTERYRKVEAYIIRLKDLIINDTKKEIVNFYAPDLKFFLFPIAWDGSGGHVQCHPQENFEALSDLGNIVLGGNNTRELSDKNQIIFSSNNVPEQIGIILMGVVFNKKIPINKRLMNDIKKEIRKSKLNKSVRLKTSFEDIDKNIKALFKQLETNIEGINQISCLANYKRDERIEFCNPPCNLLNINNEQRNIKIQSEIIV